VNIIADERQKIEIYKRIRQIDSREIYEDLKAELVDRFGKIPWQVADLLQIGFLKNLADVALLEKVAESRNEIVLTFARTALTVYKPEQYFEGLSVTEMKASVAEERGLMVIRLMTERKGADVWLPEVVKVVEKLTEMMENSKKKLDTLL
jgi:transcription-repair coupling factor (superfamily II helicase)